MMFSTVFKSTDPQVDVFRLYLVEQREHTITSYHLPVEVIRLECFELGVAIFTIDLDVLIFTELNELRRIDILWWILKILFILIPAVSEQISVHIRIDHT